MSIASALYRGQVVHARLRPRKHKLAYRVFSLLVDLDELPGLDRGSWLFGHNRRAVISIRDADHGPGTPGGLRAWIDERLADAGIAIAGLRVEMLCYPRIFGYVFNPLTVYFCRDGENTVRAILYEVCNTFGEKRTYVFAIDPANGPLEHGCAKDLYVSPFVTMDCRYGFHIVPPGERTLIRIDETDAEGLLLRASFSGQRQAWSERALLGALFAYPLMTLKVMGAIHWEALKLFLKGVPVFRHSAAAQRIAVTNVPHGGPRR